MVLWGKCIALGAHVRTEKSFQSAKSQEIREEQKKKNNLKESKSQKIKTAKEINKIQTQKIDRENNH